MEISSSHSEQGYINGGEREGNMQMSGGKKRPFDLLSRSDRLDAPFFVKVFYVETRSMRAPHPLFVRFNIAILYHNGPSFA